MNQKNLIFVIILIGLIIYFAYYASTVETFENERLTGTTYIYSNEEKIEPFLKSFANESNYYLIAKLTPSTKLYLSNFTNDFLIPYVVVLNGNSKNTIMLIQETDSIGEITCTMNSGIQDVVEIGNQECSELFEGLETNVITRQIIVEPVNPDLFKSHVLIENNKIIFKVKNISDLQKMTQDVLYFTFPNASEIIAKANNIQDSLNIS